MAMILFAVLLGTPTGAQDLTILTYNIRYDNAGDSLDRWDLRKDALAEECSSTSPR
ncbi:MAG: hypothetical protein IPN38_15980 [Flavobacteriales bacterium]|nr:hypothetical protein [Flavobacteriales bacterium]